MPTIRMEISSFTPDLEVDSEHSLIWPRQLQRPETFGQTRLKSVSLMPWML